MVGELLNLDLDDALDLGVLREVRHHAAEATLTAEGENALLAGQNLFQRKLGV
jgi:hypothetical protein